METFWNAVCFLIKYIEIVVLWWAALAQQIEVRLQNCCLSLINEISGGATRTKPKIIEIFAFFVLLSRSSVSLAHAIIFIWIFSRHFCYRIILCRVHMSAHTQKAKHAFRVNNCTKYWDEAKVCGWRRQRVKKSNEVNKKKTIRLGKFACFNRSDACICRHMHRRALLVVCSRSTSFDFVDKLIESLSFKCFFSCFKPFAFSSFDNYLHRLRRNMEMLKSALAFIMI